MLTTEAMVVNVPDDKDKKDNGHSHNEDMD
jgi:hypothetical protein